MDFCTIADDFTRLCLIYPDEPMPGMFNRYMHLLSREDQEKFAPQFPMLVRIAESARELEPEITGCFMQDLKRITLQGGEIR